MRRRDRCALLAVLGASLALALSVQPSSAAHRDRTSGGTPAHSGPTMHAADQGRVPPQLTDPEALSAGNLARDLGSSGQVDPVSGLGIRNPVCDELGEIRNREARLSCEANGSPESTYPTSNYGFDVFISTGVTHPIGDFTAAFVTILNGIWLGMIFVLKLTLELLGLAFALNPFSQGRTMAEISDSLTRLYAQMTDPWLSALVVCGGIWFAHRALLRRDLAAGVGGTLAAIAMLVLGLWVVHQPTASVGRLAQLSDRLALTVIAAPRSGSIRRPTGSYAEAMADTWGRLVEVPFAGLNFSDVGWALSPPPPEAVERSDAHFCDDVANLALLAVYSSLGNDQAAERCAAFARKRYGRPRRVIDLYLRSSPGSKSREALWDYFDKDEDERYKAKVAAQGGDGALTRLSMLALFAIGLLGAILLLAWLAIRLFTQAAVAFVLLLAAPLALFFPMLGDGGRRAFRAWGLSLLGAILAKVVYAAFLAVVLLGISILGRVGEAAGSATGFLLASAFCWAVFLKRTELVAHFSIGEEDRTGRLRLGVAGVAALGAAKRISRSAGTGATGVARRGAGWGRERAAMGAEATRGTARGALRSSGRALAEAHREEARRTVAAFEAAGIEAPEGGAGRAGGGAGAAGPDSRSRLSKRSAHGVAPSRQEYEDARDLLDRSEQARRRSGQPWTSRDLARYEAEDRELLERSRDPADHAHRAGYGRAEFEQLRGERRELAEAEIEKARRRDLRRVAIAAEPPGRLAGRGRLLAERLRQGVDGSAAERRRQLLVLRRERRERLVPSRRNLSRGG